MYIMTEKDGIINTDLYPKIDIIKDMNRYSVNAFINARPKSASTESLKIVEFDNKADAVYTLFYIYKSLESEKHAINIGDIVEISGIWSSIKGFAVKDTTDKFIDSLEFEVLSFNEFTITLPSDSDKYLHLEQHKADVEKHMRTVFCNGGIANDDQNVREIIVNWEVNDDKQNE